MMRNVVLVILSIQCSVSLALPNAGKLALDPYTFDDIFDASLRPRGFSPRWIPGEDKFYYRKNATAGGNLVLFNAATDIEEQVIITNEQFVEWGTGTYFISPTGRYVLFATDITSIWRHSFDAKYQIFEVGTDNVIPFPADDLAGKELNFAGWGSSTDALSFVYNHDLYYQSEPGAADYTRLTVDGDGLNIFNGVPDWLYEEDVVSDRVTHYWSADDSHICYARIDDTSVERTMDWPVYGPKTDVYGSTRSIKYPKAGDVNADGSEGPNSEVTLFVVEVNQSTVVRKAIAPPAAFATVSHYYLQVAWVNGSSVYVTWSNRVQNHSISVLYDVTPDTPTALTGLNYQVSGGWVEVPPPTPWFIKGGSEYLTIHAVDKSDGTKWRQLVSVSMTTFQPASLLPVGALEEVDNIYGYDEANNFVYYSSTGGEPTDRNIYRIGGVNSILRTPVCLTCDQPASCRYITSSFSSSTSYHMVNCRGPEIPTYTLRSTNNNTTNHVFEDNADVAERLATRALPTRVFMDIPIGGGYLGKAEVFMPPDFVSGNGEKYPLLMYVYAGPGSQRVMNTFPIGGSTANWLTYLKSSHNVVVASVDSRGAMGRGDKFKFQMYRNLGTVEVQDQIAAGAWFQGTPYIDPAKSSAIFGWSYGGGTTAHVIGDPTKTFMCGISVAPVTTKAYYDTAYTERYLGLATPNDDPQGYNNTDVMNKVENFRGKTFMINHGIADDNVHFMHATQLIRALANADILFHQNAYADQNHNINSPGQSRHLYHTMSDFLINDCWHNNDVPAEPDEPLDPQIPLAALPSTAVNGSLLIVISLIVSLRQHIY